MKAFDVQLAFFKPLWRRIALVALCGAWAVLEWSWGNPGWAAVFALIAAYCGHQFFWAFDPPEEDGR